MSGRLVILPHKSWNVWNQDNREKVARDERLHREAEAAKAENEKRLIQEQNLSILRADDSIIKTEEMNSPVVEVEPFRLFEDLEKKHFEKIGNEDYLKEKAAKELLQKKREGIADWALGEGSYENTKSKPWYEKLGDCTAAVTTSLPVPSSSSSSRNNKTPTSFIQREEHRKHMADPMGVMLVPNKHDYQPKQKETTTSPVAAVVLPECAAVEAAESKEQEDDHSHSSYSSVERHRKKHKKRKHRSDREEYKKSHKHSHKRRTKTENPSSNSRDTTDTGSSKPEPINSIWEEVRIRRLQRERTEGSRAAQLLAQTDIYGPGCSSGIGSSSNGGAYSSQYHPHLARNYNVGTSKR